MVCGVGDTLLAGIEYQYPVRKASTDSTSWIDALWPGVVLIEHKSAGKDLEAAEVQARDYLAGLGRRQRPPVIIVSDFFRFRVVEALTNRSIEFTLDELPEHLASFQAILSDGGVGAAHQEEAADAKAAELMADLYIAFQSAGYDGHEASGVQRATSGSSVRSSPTATRTARDLADRSRSCSRRWTRRRINDRGRRHM
jgi:hypothetical protein